MFLRIYKVFATKNAVFTNLRNKNAIFTNLRNKKAVFIHFRDKNAPHYPKKTRKSRQNGFRNKTAYVWALDYRWRSIAIDDRRSRGRALYAALFHSITVWKLLADEDKDCKYFIKHWLYSRMLPLFYFYFLLQESSQRLVQRKLTYDWQVVECKCIIKHGFKSRLFS